MSQKWRRSIQWERESIPPALRPLGWVLHAFSTITLAVVLLSSVIVFAVLASVPVGLLALAPTYAVYALTLVLTVALAAALPLAALMRATRRVGRGTRFVLGLAGVVGLGVGAVWAWGAFVWPALHYDPVSGRGLRLFAGFVEGYKATTLRRLPGLEMSELEFYAWWPLRVVLLAFVANMITATVRRIEFTFENLGVLTVHTGIVVMTLGSIYYAGLKREGDTILLAGAMGEDGTPQPGPPQDLFYDNTSVALSVGIDGRWETRVLRGVPRYNDYNLGAGAGETASGRVGQASDAAGLGALDVPVRTGLNRSGEGEVRLRLVGYASYAEPQSDWARADPPARGPANPVRFVDLISALPDAQGRADPRPVATMYFLPDLPSHRWRGNEAFAVEFTRGMGEDRWRALAEPLPEGAAYGLVVEVPETGYRGVFAAADGARFEPPGSGYVIEVKQVRDEPQFPIITPGYRGASSSMAVVRVTPPEGPSFERWTYHRFPEIDQDMVDGEGEGGPRRRPAETGSIRLWLVDATRVQVYADERPDGSLRVISRRTGGEAAVTERVEPGAPVEMVPQLSLRLAESWEHAEAVERPVLVPERSRQRELIGGHEAAMLGVEVSAPGLTRVLWLPFMKYREAQDPQDPLSRSVDLPDGRRVSLVWGRLAHGLPGFTVQLRDFRMVAYDHRGAPRDYQSTLRVTFESGGWYDHVARLNAPLTAPFLWTPERGLVSNVAGRLAAGLNPNQFKFSQAGWDARTWEQTQQAADRGLTPRPYVGFTILGVGNNPGIHVIALGGVLVALGTPWAFYVKPLIVRRRKQRIEAEVSAGTYRRRGAEASLAGATP